MSDGSDSAVAVFEPIKAEEAQMGGRDTPTPIMRLCSDFQCQVQDDTFAAVLKVPELPQALIISVQSVCSSMFHYFYCGVFNSC